MFSKRKKGIAVFLTALLLLAGCGKEQAAMAGAGGQEQAAMTGAAAGGEMRGSGLVNKAAVSAAPLSDGLESSAFSLREEMKVLATPEVTLVMVGDILMHMPVNNSGRLADGSRNFDHLFTYTKDMIEAADIAIVNQEVILGGPELGISGYPRFNTYYEVGDALVNAGFDVILHATNHSLDRGREGIENCLAFWEEHYPDIAVVGIYDSKEKQDEIYVCEQEGIKIAILNYTYGTNGLPFPAGMPYAVNLLDRERIASDVARAKEIADFVVLCPHWGTEYQKKPSGYHTVISSQETELSGGERQLLSFARLILKDPDIIILDEATSNIDTETEKLIQKMFSTVLKGKTSFVIAHRLSAIKNADRILYVDDNGILEDGSHEELMQKKGLYYGLVQKG